MTDYFLKDHQPSAMECEARLRGLWRIISSKTICSRLPACLCLNIRHSNRMHVD